MEFNVVLNQVIILFVILIIGFVAGKKNIIDSTGTKKLSELLLFVSAPMMVFKSFLVEYTYERLTNILWVSGSSFIMFVITIIISKYIYKGFNEQLKPILRFTAIFSNCGYVGLPLLKAILGDDGVFYGSFYVVVFHAVLWSYGYMMFGEKESNQQAIKRLLRTPSIIAFLIGIVVFLLKIPVPNAIKDATSAVGDMTMPLSMLIIGGVMSTSKLVTVFNDWRVYLASFVRLIAMPLLGLLLSRIMGVPVFPTAVLVTALAMPAAANTTIFAERADKDAVFASNCVTVSTLLSIITIPLIITIMSRWLF